MKDIEGVFTMSLQDAGRIESFVHEESVTEAATKCIRASAEVKIMSALHGWDMLGLRAQTVTKCE